MGLVPIRVVYGMWCSLGAHALRVGEVAGSKSPLRSGRCWTRATGTQQPAIPTDEMLV